MLATQQLHDLGQSLWLDNITRDLLNSGGLKRYIDELFVMGLTSNPTIFDHAAGRSCKAAGYSLSTLSSYKVCRRGLNGSLTAAGERPG